MLLRTIESLRSMMVYLALLQKNPTIIPQYLNFLHSILKKHSLFCLLQLFKGNFLTNQVLVNHVEQR